MEQQNINLKSLFISLFATLIAVSTLFLVLKSDLGKGFSFLTVALNWIAIAVLAMKANFWKGMAIWLLLYTVFFGLLGPIPQLVNNLESTRNLYFHVCMWFAMIFLFLASVIYSILFLAKEKIKYDVFAEGAAHAGIILGILGLLTGMVWARYTWGKFWSGDPKQIYTAIGLLLYVGYFILRGALTDEIKRARLAAVVNVFAFPSLIVLLYVLPRMLESLHPGNEGTMVLSSEDVNNNMRLVFYPAIVGWTLLGVWISSLRIRAKLLEQEIINY